MPPLAAVHLVRAIFGVPEIDDSKSGVSLMLGTMVSGSTLETLGGIGK